MKVYYKAGQNTHDAKSLFNSRKDYARIHAQASQTGDRRKLFRHIDMRSQYPLYGKIDYKGKPVYVLPESAMDVLRANEIIHCVNFVADAYNDFREYYNRIYEKGMMDDVGDLTTMEAVSGYINPMVAYEQNLTTLKKHFLGKVAYMDPDSITDVRNFMDKMAEEMLKLCHDFPITLSGHVLSPKCSVKTTGLVIDLMNEDRGADKKKLQMVFSDNYNKYVAMATKFGFRIDYHAPWSLVADLRSTRLEQYMKPYGLESAMDYFNEYCVQTYFDDIKRIKNLFYDAYYEFVTNVRFRRVIPTCPNGIPKSKAAEFERRKQHRLEDLDNMFGDKYWLDFYMKARYNELNLNIFEKMKQDMYQKVMFIYSQRGMMPALKHACEYFDSLNLENYKLANTIQPQFVEPGYLSEDERDFEDDELDYQYATEPFMESEDWAAWNEQEYDIDDE